MFVSYVQWGNDVAIDALTREGARVSSSEPGIARIEIDLPIRVADVADSSLRRILGAIGAVNQTLLC
jgi:hypothetical protein